MSGERIFIDHFMLRTGWFDRDAVLAWMREHSIDPGIVRNIVVTPHSIEVHEFALDANDHAYPDPDEPDRAAMRAPYAVPLRRPLPGRSA